MFDVSQVGRSSRKRAAVYRRRQRVRVWSRSYAMLALELAVYGGAAWLVAHWWHLGRGG